MEEAEAQCQSRWHPTGSEDTAFQQRGLQSLGVSRLLCKGLPLDFWRHTQVAQGSAEYVSMLRRSLALTNNFPVLSLQPPMEPESRHLLEFVSKHLQCLGLLE